MRFTPPPDFARGLPVKEGIVRLRPAPTGFTDPCRHDRIDPRDVATVYVRSLIRAAAFVAICWTTAAACADAQSTRTLGPALAGYSLGAGDGTRLDLPARLAEISGLAVSSDGRVFAHNDERAEVFQIDPATGAVVKSFSIGQPRLSGDFEGIAIAGTRFFLMTSDGVLHEFEEGEAGANVAYREIDTELGTRCEFEGFEYDARTEALLLACKTPRVRTLRGRLAVVAYSLRENALEATPRLLLPLDFLRGAGQRVALSPSGIAIHPQNGNYVIVAGRENLLVEVTREGQLVGVSELARRAHPQAEGIAFLRDGTLLISDERTNRGLLTRYPAPAPSMESQH